jgi:hypothetical protein
MKSRALQLTWRDDPVAAKNDQATKAANIVAAAVEFYVALQEQRLEPDIFHTKVGRDELFEIDTNVTI